MKHTFYIDTDSDLFHEISDIYGFVPYDNIDGQNLDIIQYYCDELKKMLPNYPDVNIMIVNENRPYVGVFIAGTSTSTPTFLIHEKVFSEDSVEIGLTLYHEVGHSLFELDREICGGKYLSHISDEEEFVENFAYDMSFLFGAVSYEFEQLLNDEELIPHNIIPE